MNTQPTHTTEVSKRYSFDSHSLQTKISENLWVKEGWPIVYILQNSKNKIAYIGESTKATNRINNHLNNPKKTNIFNEIRLITSDKFNKSATLDIESNLIQYISADGTYKLENGNLGLVNHNYYQKKIYLDIFSDIWKQLLEKNFVKKSLSEIKNSELFKYSPYKALNDDQYNSIFEILNSLTTNTYHSSLSIMISGSAGTGKTVLATYLMKLLNSDIPDIEEGESDPILLEEVNLIKKFNNQYSEKPKIALVIAMSSLRETIKKVFRHTHGLDASMVIGPSDVAKHKGQYDLLIIDEAHRLRQGKNISWLGIFKKNNQLLGLDSNHGNELDWIMLKSTNQIFFYDHAQSIKPSDVDAKEFSKILNTNNTVQLTLQSQMRTQGGNGYIDFVDELLHVKKNTKKQYSSNEYELKLFDSFTDFHKEIGKKEKIYGLSRMVAGYSWPWDSKGNTTKTDIEIEGIKLCWNRTSKDWINASNSSEEVGCIHTTQGYDLNYTGVIFGREITYNKVKNKIEINPKLYFDKSGKNGIKDPEKLKEYIINIYKTIMYRGIKGTFVFVCDPNLREYMKQHIQTYKQS